MLGTESETWGKKDDQLRWVGPTLREREGQAELCWIPLVASLQWETPGRSLDFPDHMRVTSSAQHLTPDPWALQCAAFDSQEFMGQLYQWEPFTEGEVSSYPWNGGLKIGG